MARASTIRILAYDPGITKTGWMLLAYDTGTGKVTVLRYGTMVGRMLIRDLKPLLEKFNKQFVTLEAYRLAFELMIHEMKPDYVVSEGAFNHLFPQVFASLTLVIDRIRQASFAALGQDIHLIAPMASKKALTGRGDADKEMMRKHFFAHPDIEFKVSKQTPIEMADEHAVDAGAHGFGFSRNDLPAILADKAMAAVETLSEAKILPLPAKKKAAVVVLEDVPLAA